MLLTWRDITDLPCQTIVLSDSDLPKPYHAQSHRGIQWLGSDSVPGFDHDGFGLRNLVSCPFPQSCLKGYACNAPASYLHDCFKYVFSWRTTLAHNFHGCSRGYRWSLNDRDNQRFKV